MVPMVKFQILVLYMKSKAKKEITLRGAFSDLDRADKNIEIISLESNDGSCGVIAVEV